MKRGLSQRFWKRWNRVHQNAGIGPSHHLKIFRLPTYFFQLPTNLASHFWSPSSLLQMFSSHPHFLSLSLSFSLFLNPFPLLLSSSLLKTHHFFSKISNTKILPKTTNPTQSKVSISSSHFYFVAIFVYIFVVKFLVFYFWFWLKFGLDYVHIFV